MRLRGFTLIELMVVIVIMGILSAVAVPKLSVSIAKSKANEVPVAAAAYIKLQDAYVIERKKVGSWKRIGYKAPKSSNFTYGNERNPLSAKSAPDLSTAQTLGQVWTAVNVVPMGNCLKDNLWYVDIISHGADANGNIGLEYKSEVLTGDCAALVSGWGAADGSRSIAGEIKTLTPASSTPSSPAVAASSESSGGSMVEGGSSVAGGSTVESSAATVDPNVTQYKSCSAANGGSDWLNGNKKGWEKDPDKNACLQLRASLKSSGVLVCKNKETDDCNLEFKDEASECLYTGSKCK